MTVNDLVLALRRRLSELTGHEYGLDMQLDPEAGSVRLAPDPLRRLLLQLAREVKHSVADTGTLSISTQRVSINGTQLQGWPEVPSGEYVVTSITARQSESGTLGSRKPPLSDSTEPQPKWASVAMLLPKPDHTAVLPIRPASKPETVLLLGQQSDIRASLRLVLLHHGYEVMEAANEHHASVTCRNFGDKIDAVIVLREPGDEEHGEDARDLPACLGLPSFIAPEAKGDDSRDRQTILIVDDDGPLRRMVAAVLETAGYHVVQARNGRDALQAIGMHVPQLVLTELVMPEADGLQLIQELRRVLPEVKIIATSGVPRAGTYLSVARVLGAQSTIRKPLHAGELLETVQELLSTQ